MWDTLRPCIYESTQAHYPVWWPLTAKTTKSPIILVNGTTRRCMGITWSEYTWYCTVHVIEFDCVSFSTFAFVFGCWTVACRIISVRGVPKYSTVRYSIYCRRESCVFLCLPSLYFDNGLCMLMKRNAYLLAMQAFHLMPETRNWIIKLAAYNKPWLLSSLIRWSGAAAVASFDALLLFAPFSKRRWPENQTMKTYVPLMDSLFPCLVRALSRPAWPRRSLLVEAAASGFPSGSLRWCTHTYTQQASPPRVWYNVWKCYRKCSVYISRSLA